MAEYGRFPVERDLETARIVAEASPPTAEGLLLLAWLRNAGGYDPAAALSGAAERGSCAARLCLAMRALVKPADAVPAKDALSGAFTAPSPKKQRITAPPPPPLRSGSALKRRPLCWERRDAVPAAVGAPHYRAVVELMARGYEPAIACARTLRLYAHSAPAWAYLFVCVCVYACESSLCMCVLVCVCVCGVSSASPCLPATATWTFTFRRCWATAAPSVPW